ncbi:hypothetical protein FGO68_gene11338 [Halteria grandinella]|uniref:Uncharacterized protein n=1 Tax=Halteria grandinella TaxID=5974 RepID=A0A8J8NEM5_HALGN|nr:hypothetical protein FGO68_gene11338 [Halteria grandinella]
MMFKLSIVIYIENEIVYMQEIRQDYMVHSCCEITLRVPNQPSCHQYGCSGCALLATRGKAISSKWPVIGGV